MSRQSTEQNGRRGMPIKDDRANKDNDELVYVESPTEAFGE
jgi:hypothetical protein